MVADGIDASQGQADYNGDDWLPAVSRSTHRRFLRRKARWEQNEALVEKDCQDDTEKNKLKMCCKLQQSAEKVQSGNGISEQTEQEEADKGDCDISSILKQMRLEEDSAVTTMEEDVSDDNQLVFSFVRRGI